MSKAIVAKNTIAQIIGRACLTGAGFFVTILIARTYGTTGFGEFTTITSLVAFGYLFVDFGLNAAYVKIDEKKSHFIDFLFLRLAAGIVAAFLLVIPIGIAGIFGITFFSITPPLYPGLLIFSLTILTQAALTTYTALFQVHKQYEFQALALIPGAIFLIGAVLWVTAHQLSLPFVYGAYVLSGVLSVAIAGYILRKHFSLQWPSHKFIGNLLIKGLPLGILLIFNLIYFRIDALILSALKGSEAVGIYGYGYKFFDFALTIPLFLSNALYPFLLDNLKNPRKGRVSEGEYFFIFTGLGTLFAFVGFLLSPIIGRISPGFDDSVWVLQILCLSLPLFFLTSYVQWLLIAGSAEKRLLWIYILVALVNILLNLYFVPTYSYVAAAAITGLSEGFVLVLLLCVLHSTKNLRKARAKQPTVAS